MPTSCAAHSRCFRASRWFTDCDILSEASGPDVRSAGQATRRRRPCRKSYARTADVSFAKPARLGCHNPGPADVTIETQVRRRAREREARYRARHPEHRRQPCAKPTDAYGFDPRTTSAPGAPLTPRASASADTVAPRAPIGSRCSRTAAGLRKQTEQVPLPQTPRPSIPSSTRPGTSCTAWASAVTHTSPPCAIRAGRTPARRSCCTHRRA